MRILLLTLLSLVLAASAGAAAPKSAVVRPAPDFSIIGPGEKPRPLRNFRGQPIVLVIGDSTKNGAVKKQLKLIQEIYSELASKGVVLVAAFANTDDPIPTNIPVAIASNGAAVASAYGVSKGFQIAIIGRDGNLDYQTDKVQTGDRIRVVIQNSAEVQSSARKQP